MAQTLPPTPFLAADSAHASVEAATSVLAGGGGKSELFVSVSVAIRRIEATLDSLVVLRDRLLLELDPDVDDVW